MLELVSVIRTSALSNRVIMLNHIIGTKDILCVIRNSVLSGYVLTWCYCMIIKIWSYKRKPQIDQNCSLKKYLRLEILNINSYLSPIMEISRYLLLNLGWTGHYGWSFLFQLINICDMIWSIEAKVDFFQNWVINRIS